METIIPLRLEVPNTPIAFADLETRVQDAGRATVRALYAAAWVAQLALSTADPCPHCGGTDTRAAGTKPRRIETPAGAVTVPRPRRQCLACGGRFQPATTACGRRSGAANSHRCCGTWP